MCAGDSACGRGALSASLCWVARARCGVLASAWAWWGWRACARFASRPLERSLRGARAGAAQPQLLLSGWCAAGREEGGCLHCRRRSRDVRGLSRGAQRRGYGWLSCSARRRRLGCSGDHRGGWRVRCVNACSGDAGAWTEEVSIDKCADRSLSY